MTLPERSTEMTEKTILTVNDMTCNHCVGTVRSALEEALPGTQVDIDLATKTVRFTGDRNKGEDAIREAGYTPEAA
jgi:copper chaperone